MFNSAKYRRNCLSLFSQTKLETWGWKNFTNSLQYQRAASVLKICTSAQHESLLNNNHYSNFQSEIAFEFQVEFWFKFNIPYFEWTLPSKAKFSSVLIPTTALMISMAENAMNSPKLITTIFFAVVPKIFCTTYV